jgi:hypothetical protein
MCCASREPAQNFTQYIDTQAGTGTYIPITLGGEPLMYEQHWRYMKRIIELGDGPQVYARYNTNLSRVEYRGINLYRDILPEIRDWQICASLDGTGAIGEYIRTGLDYDQWLENFRGAVAIQRHSRQVRIDFTLTLPGMFEVKKITKLAQQFNVGVLAKVIFSFSPDIVMSPFEEQWPDEYQQGFSKGRARILQLEQIRSHSITMTDILAARPAVLEWWLNHA